MPTNTTNTTTKLGLSQYANNDIVNVMTNYNSDMANIDNAVGTLIAELDANGKLKQMPSASDVGAVPTSLKINSHALTSDITLTPSDIGAATVAQGAKADSAIQTSQMGVASGIATTDSNNKVIQNPASYGQVGGAALISELPASPTLATLNPDGTLSSGSESGLLALSLKGGTTAGEFAYTVQQGQYTMIDKLCIAQIYIKISSIVQAAAGDLYLTGLPVGVGPIDRASITGRIAGADFHGVLNTITGLVYPANSVNTVNAAALKAADGFCCSISYRC